MLDNEEKILNEEVADENTVQAENDMVETDAVETNDVATAEAFAESNEGEVLNATPEVKKENALNKLFSAVKGKIKGIFKKDEVELPPELKEINKLLGGNNLSTGEKVRRFLKSQSGWLFVLPAVILMVVFTFYPIVNAFVGAFKLEFKQMTNTYDGIGFGNFIKVLKGDVGSNKGANFLQCLFNTLVFTLISVPLSTILALLISVALTRIKALQKAYQTILFLPYLTNALAMGAVFATFFTIVGTTRNTETVGLVNTVLSWFGADTVNNPIHWMDSRAPYWELGSLRIPWTKYIVLIIYEVWSGLPFKILILFSSLMSVNKQYYDAAKIDGASRSTVLWKITTPMIAPMLSYLIITGIMGGMKQYTAVVGLFGEEMGTNFDMGTMVGYIYIFVKGAGNTGYACAGSVLLFIIIMAITMLNRFISKRTVKF